MALVLKHQTTTEFVARVRSAYRDGDPTTLVKIARFIIARIQAGDLTDAQCSTAFGLNATQWTTLKTKMTNLVTADNTVNSAVGE